MKASSADQQKESVGVTALSSWRTLYRADALQVALFGFLALGILIAIINSSWPIARNAIDYAKAASDILIKHFDLYAVVRDGEWNGGKPLLFSLIATPFVWLSNANMGVVMASTVGTAFFLWTISLAIPRINRHSGVDPAFAPLEFALTVCNPLVVYQFWSGYPDSLFAGLVIAAFVLTDIIACEPERDTRWHIVGLALTIIAAIYTKLYGAMLGVMCPMSLLLQGRYSSMPMVYPLSKVALFGGVVAAVATILLTAKFGLNPLLSLGPQSGTSDYLSGIQSFDLESLKGAVLLLVFSIVLVFQVALLFLFPRNAWRAWSHPQTVFVAVYLLGLLPSGGTAFNMRYFLPVLPFLAPLFVSGARSFPTAVRNGVFLVYSAVALLTIANFNLAPVEEALKPLTQRIYALRPEFTLWLDNLRLPAQIKLKTQIDAINAAVPPGGILYWSSDYYGTATHGMANDLGVRRSIDVRYVLEPTDPPPNSQTVFMTEFTAFRPPESLWRAPPWATAKALGSGLFRLDPISVELVSLSGDFVDEGGTVKLEARVRAADHVKVGAVEFMDGGVTIHSDPKVSYPFTLVAPSRGRHEFLAKVYYDDAEASFSDPVVVYVGPAALERAARPPRDLFAEFRDGVMYASQATMSLDRSFHAIGARFGHVTVPQGIHIIDARLELTAGAAESRATTLEVRAERSARPGGLRFRGGDLSGRPLSTASVIWRLDPWRVAGEQIRSPNLAPIVEEIVAQPDWRSDNAILLIIRVSGRGRSIRTFDQKGHGAPVLYLQPESK